MKTRLSFLVVVLTAVPLHAADLPAVSGSYVATGSLESAHATQAATGDEKHIYAISNSLVVQYDRKTGEEIAKSKGQAEHLNSGFLWEGKVYCAHSNYPKMPHQSDIRVCDPKTMGLTIFHTFKEPPGSLTWAVRRDKHWWCFFAHYGKDNAKSVLLKYDDDWKELARWTLPPELVKDLGEYSLSGGIWQDDELWTTGHDKKLIYRLKLPKEGPVLQVTGVVKSPYPGQGIAVDPKTGGLIGINRSMKQIVYARFEGK